METKVKIVDVCFKCPTLVTERTCKLVNALKAKGFKEDTTDRTNLVVVVGGLIEYYKITDNFLSTSVQEISFDQAMKLVSEIEDPKCKFEIKYSDDRNLFYVEAIFPEPGTGPYIIPPLVDIHHFLEQEYTKIMFENGKLKNKLSYLNEPEPTKLKKGVKLIHYKSSDGQCQTKCPYRHDVGVASHACDMCSYQIDRYVNLTMNEVVYGIVVCNHLDKD